MTGDECPESTDTPGVTPSPVAMARSPVRVFHSRAKIALLVLVAILAIATHVYWLRWAAAPLRARSLPKGFSPTLIWLHSGDGHSLPGQDTLNILVELQHRHGAKILFTVGRPSRVVALGALPCMDEVVRQAVARKGIPPENVIGAPYRRGQLWDAAEWLQEYLKKHRGDRVLFLSETFAGAAAERVFDRAMAPDIRERVAVFEVPDRRFDVRYWWRSRTGVKAIMSGYLFGTHGLVVPRPPDPPEFTVRELLDRFPPRVGGAP